VTRCAALLVALVLVACRRPPADAPPSPVAAAPAPPAPEPTVAPPDDDLVGEAPENNPTSETVTIKLIAESARKAHVIWGRKDLGLAPLEIQRPRGSGPLDLLVVAPGALPLHTRVYTDRDDKLALRLYAESEAPGLLGYHEPVEPPPAPRPSSRPPLTKASARADAAKQKRTP
jgi:hypothetical protein